MPWHYVELDFILLGLCLGQTCKHYWAKARGEYYLMGQLSCLCVFLPLCLSVFAWSACLSAWFPLYLLCGFTVVNLSLCLSDCQLVLSIWPTLSHITNNHCHSHPPLHNRSLPPWVPFRISFFQFHCTLFFHVFRGIEILGSPSSHRSTGLLRPTSRGPDRGCLLSCYLSPS